MAEMVSGDVPNKSDLKWKQSSTAKGTAVTPGRSLARLIGKLDRRTCLRVFYYKEKVEMLVEWVVRNVGEFGLKSDVAHADRVDRRCLFCVFFRQTLWRYHS